MPLTRFQNSVATQTFNGSNTSSRSVLAVQCVNGARSIPSRPTYNPLLYHTRASGTDLRAAAIHAIRLFVHAVPSFQRSMTRSSLGSLQRNRGAPSRTPCLQREGRNVALSPATTMRTSARRSGASPPPAKRTPIAGWSARGAERHHATHYRDIFLLYPDFPASRRA